MEERDVGMMGRLRQDEMTQWPWFEYALLDNTMIVNRLANNLVKNKRAGCTTHTSVSMTCPYIAPKKTNEKKTINLIPTPFQPTSNPDHPLFNQTSKHTLTPLSPSSLPSPLSTSLTHSPAPSSSSPLKILSKHLSPTTSVGLTTPSNPGIVAI